jgi:crotonobetainyl-CoA:carnitine CoA-transferase CaiB-like acyl-CoA transferase
MSEQQTSSPQPLFKGNGAGPLDTTTDDGIPLATVSGKSAFADVRIIDLSGSIWCEFATKMFADLGADVIKVEPPGVGSATRYWRPVAGCIPDPERNPLFLHLNTNKRSVCIDFENERDRALLLDLVRGSDALVESFAPGYLESIGLDLATLRVANPNLVITRISPFGQNGPYRDWLATDFTLQAMGGPMHATGGPGKPPLRKPGNLPQYSVGRAAGEATLAGLIAARRFGTPSVLDVAAFEVLLSSADRRASYILTASYSGVDAPRGVRSAHRGLSKFTGPYQAKDGYIMVHVANQTFWDRLMALISEDEPEFSAYRDSSIPPEQWESLGDSIKQWIATQPKIELMERAEAARIPLTAIMNIDEVLSHQHFRERGVFVPLTRPDLGRLEYVGYPWRMENGFSLTRPAPLLDADRTAVRTEAADMRRTERPGLDWPAVPPHGERPSWLPPGRFPLQGLRIIDLTVVWSGPGGTALLSDLGAEVIRLEGNNRMTRQDSSTWTKESLANSGYRAWTFPGGEPSPRPYDRSAVFNWHARNKLAACANLETPEGREALLRLVDVSDVLVENSAAATLDKLGLGENVLLRRNPRLIVARMPPMGLSGSMRDYLGYGPNFNSLVGIAAMDGYENQEPDSAGENYHMDEASPAGVAFAVMAALWDRDQTGRGGLIEFAQSENVMQDVGEFVLSQQIFGIRAPRLGNSHAEYFQDVLPCADDSWLAISVRDDSEWAVLSRLVGSDLLLELGSTDQLRRLNSERLLRVLADWTRDRHAAELVAMLQLERVPAGEVLPETRLLADPHLGARGWFRRRSHPATGTHLYPGHPWQVDGFDVVYGRPFPAFGEDNEYVYRRILRYSRSSYDELVSRHLVTDEQFA